jgi:hypothetical protein
MKKLSPEAHLEIAEHLRTVNYSLVKAECLISHGRPFVCHQMRNIRKARKEIDDLCNTLDNDWYADCMASGPEGETFREKYGWPYYGDIAKYKNMAGG